MCFALVGCGKEETNNGGTTGGNNTSKKECKRTKSDDSFVGKYDYAEEYMMPEKGVFTGYTNQSGYFYFNVHCITSEELQEYTEVLLDNGFVFENFVYKNKEKNIKIIITDNIESLNFIYVYVYPALDM